MPTIAALMVVFFGIAVAGTPVTTAGATVEKPVRGSLEQHPYGQIDYTAYTLEWGEARVGLASSGIGVLPRVHVSTVPVLSVLKIYNGAAKWDAVRAGPLDVSAAVSAYVLPLGDFLGTVVAPGATVSLRVAEPFTLHAGARYVDARGSGIPDPAAMPKLVTGALGVDPADLTGIYDQAVAYGSTSFAAQGTMVRFAADVRFNRRDSLVVQVGGLVDGSLAAHAAAPVFGIDESVAGGAGLADTLTATLSYQASFRSLDLRLGGGTSALPAAWAVQGNDIAMRAFGRTRREEARAIAAWRSGEDPATISGISVASAP